MSELLAALLLDALRDRLGLTAAPAPDEGPGACVVPLSGGSACFTVITDGDRLHLQSWWVPRARESYYYWQNEFRLEDPEGLPMTALALLAVMGCGPPPKTRA